MELSSRLNMSLIIGGVVLLAAIGTTVYMMYGRTSSVSEIPEIDTGPDISTQVSNAVETPAEKLPETNPFAGYKNPFE